MEKKLLTALKPNDSIFYIAGRSVSDGDDHVIEFKVKEVMNIGGRFSIRNSEWNDDNNKLFEYPTDEISSLDCFVDKYGYYGTTRESVINLYNKVIDGEIRSINDRLERETKLANDEISRLISQKLSL